MYQPWVGRRISGANRARATAVLSNKVLNFMETTPSVAWSTSDEGKWLIRS
jgi:hypothetical protein